MSEAEALSFKARVTLALGGVLTALAIERLFKLYTRLNAPKMSDQSLDAKAASAAQPASAAAASIKAQVSIQYCGCARSGSTTRATSFARVAARALRRNSPLCPPPCIASRPLRMRQNCLRRG